MKIKNYYEPFPYIIIDDYYDEGELSLIWEELNFLCYPTKLRRATTKRGGATTPEGTLLKFNYHSYLDGLYAFRDMSNILMVNRKLFGNGYEIFRQHDSWFFKNLHINKDNTQVGYYEENDEYKTHVDSSTITSLTWLHKTPKRFTGGDLILPDYNVEIKSHNNRTFIFPSFIKHGVVPVRMEEQYRNTKSGRFCISQFGQLDMSAIMPPHHD